MFWRKKSYFDNSAPDIKNRRKQPCQVRYMAPIEQFFVTLNVATPDLFARFDKRKDRQKLRQAINPSAGMLRSGLKTRHLWFHSMETILWTSSSVVQPPSPRLVDGVQRSRNVAIITRNTKRSSIRPEISGIDPHQTDYKNIDRYVKSWQHSLNYYMGFV